MDATEKIASRIDRNTNATREPWIGKFYKYSSFAIINGAKNSKKQGTSLPYAML